MQTVLHPHRILFFLYGNSRHTDDCVHGRADFMGHPGKEIALRPACQVIALTVDIAFNNLGYFQKLPFFRFTQVQLIRIRRIGDTACIFSAVV